MSDPYLNFFPPRYVHSLSTIVYCFKITQMKKTIFLMFLLVCMHAQAQNQRKFPIREGGQTIDAGNIPESIRTNDTTLNGETDVLRSRPGKMKVGRVTRSGINCVFIRPCATAARIRRCKNCLIPKYSLYLSQRTDNDASMAQRLLHPQGMNLGWRLH